MVRLANPTKIDILKNILGRYFNESQDQKLFHCPKCGHHKKKLSVNISKNMFKCWVCEWSGRDIYSLVKRFGSYNDKKNWRQLTNKVEVQNFYETLFGQQEQEQQNIALPEGFISLANKKLPSTSLYALNYLFSRGLTKKDIIRWKIGYTSEGDYEGRIIIPSFDIAGKLNYFIARAYDGHWKRYKNPKNKRDIIFNEINLNIKQDVILVEGVFDAIKAGQNSVPLLGSTLNEKSKIFDLIISNNLSVYLALDKDAKRKTNKIIDSLLRHDVNTYLIDLGNYSDVGEMTHKKFLTAKSNAKQITQDQFFYSKITSI